MNQSKDPCSRHLCPIVGAVDPGFRAQPVLCMRDIPSGENGGPNPCEEWVVTVEHTLQSDRRQDKGTASAINKEGLGLEAASLR